MEQLINITDTVFLGHVGEIELGASAIAGIYYLAIYMLGFGFSIGLQVMVARRNGEQDYKETGKTFFQGLFFLLGLAIFLYLLIHTVSPFILKKLIVSSDIYRAVILYLDWRSFGLLFSFPFLAIRSFLVGITHTKALSWAAAIAVLINIPLNFYLIFTRELGISGAAIASSLAEMGSFMMLSFYMWIRLDKEKYGLRPVYNGNLLIKVLKLSTWSMLHALISVAPWFLFFVSIEHLGKIELAISNITRSVSAIFFVIANSFALTTGSLVSNAIGAGEGKTLFSICSKILKLGYTISFCPFCCNVVELHFRFTGLCIFECCRRNRKDTNDFPFSSYDNSHIFGLSLLVMSLHASSSRNLFNSGIRLCNSVGYTIYFLFEKETLLKNEER